MRNDIQGKIHLRKIFGTTNLRNMKSLFAGEQMHGLWYIVSQQGRMQQETGGAPVDTAVRNAKM